MNIANQKEEKVNYNITLVIRIWIFLGGFLGMS